MACCQNCAQGTAPCAGASVQSVPLRGIAKKVGVGAMSVGGMAVAPPAGGVGGALLGWWLGGMVGGKRNTIVKAVGAAAGAWAGYQAGAASGL